MIVATELPKNLDCDYHQPVQGQSQPAIEADGYAQSEEGGLTLGLSSPVTTIPFWGEV